ncbi:MAG: branched-chain amino acid ABC transporter permease [Chloroflexi bacterium]|nr:branched-chain amino acid ABC transporter permease [Chloroflexota bacterium]
MDTALSAIVEGLLRGGVYALIALGVVVVFKASKVLNLMVGGLMVFFTFLLWWLAEEKDLPVGAAVVLTFIAAVAVGLFIYRFLMQPVIGATMLVTFIMTIVLGLSVILGISMLWFGGSAQVMPSIFRPTGNLDWGGVTFPRLYLVSFIVATGMFLLFVAYFRYTKTGLLMRCVSEDNIISQSLGINVKRIYAIAWIVGCLSAAIGGILMGSMSAVSTDMGFFAMARALPVLLLGGLESLPGAYIGAMIIGVAESLGSTYIDPHVTGFSELLPFILMLTILLIRPQGLFGLKIIRRI